MAIAKKQLRQIISQVLSDRKGEFESKLIHKYQRDVSGIEDKVISLSHARKGILFLNATRLHL